MAIALGQRLGSYQVLSLIGRGGMGEVYRARDTQLQRDVALKLLPEMFASDPERLGRFQREAQLLASLNHSNIASIYGLEESGPKALVLELVEGPTLAERIAQGPIPIDEIMSIARQIADALEYAHEHGVMHRDLKPANIKLRPDGAVKVLDFGLAKALNTDTRSPITSNSPTLSLAATQAGVILGTAAYMSPEQAKGKEVDRRADIWAFGVIVYEMLAARMLFSGETASEMMAAVIMKEPDWEALPADMPSRLRGLLKRCLVKDPRSRLRDIGDARLAIEEIIAAPEPELIRQEPSSHVSLQPSRTWLLWAAAAALVVVAFLGGVMAHSFFWRTPALLPVTRLSFSLPPDSDFTNLGRPVIAISPDGRKIVYNADRQLYVRSLDKNVSEPIRGSASPTGLTTPIFSPDGKWIGYFADGFLKKIPVTGGAAVPITRVPLNFGASWTAGGDILYAARDGIFRVSANGGMAKMVIAAKPNEAMASPQMLSDGDHLLFTVTTDVTNDRWEKAQIVVQSLSSGERTVAVQNGSDGRYVTTGHIVYRVGGTVFGIGYDPKRRSTVGTPVAVLENVRYPVGGGNTPAAHYALSETGSLAYIPETAVNPRHAFIVNSDGRTDPAPISNDVIEYPRVSPDGLRLAAQHDGTTMIYDLTGKAAPMRVPTDGISAGIWAPDGKRLAMEVRLGEKPGLYIRDLQTNAPAERLLSQDQSGRLESWSSDGRILFFMRDGKNWTLTLGEKEPKLLPIESETWSMSISPDVHWLAYYVSEGGAVDVFVQPYPPTGAKYQVTRGGGHHPIWSPDGKRLYYVHNTDQLMAVDVIRGDTISFGPPIQLKVTVDQLLNQIRNYDVLPDGKRFVVSIPAQQNPLRQVHVVLNWLEELKQRVPGVQ